VRVFYLCIHSFLIFMPLQPTRYKYSELQIQEHQSLRETKYLLDIFCEGAFYLEL